MAFLSMYLCFHFLSSVSSSFNYRSLTSLVKFIPRYFILFNAVVNRIVFFNSLSDSFLLGFSDSSVGKESACKAGELRLIPGLGRSAGKGIGYPLQYSWASLVAQLLKDLPAMQETCVQSLGWGDSLEKLVQGVSKSWTWLSDFPFTFW